jgi:broad specificity phosphatase PhoE
LVLAIIATICWGCNSYGGVLTISENYTVTVYLMRHGQTEANLNGVVNGGGSDTPLLPGGRAKLKSVGDALNDVEFAACYSSPLGRTRRSAQIVLKSEQVLE